MSKRWRFMPMSEVCIIRPSKSEARKRLKNTDLVSFMPMEDLGIGTKAASARQQRSLGEVSGSYTYFAEGDILLAKITPCFENGKLGIARQLANEVGFGSSEFLVLRPRPEIDPEFLYYYLDRSAFREQGAASMTGAVGHKRIAKDFLDNYLVPIPTLHEQRQVVTLLDDAFEAIAKARSIAAKELAIFAELGSALEERCFDRYADHSFCPVPLSDLCVFIVDCEHKTAPTQDSGFPLIRTPNIGRGKLLLDGVKRVSEETYRAWSRRATPEPGDLILAREAPAGNVAVIPPRLKVCLGQRTVLIRPKSGVLVSQYLAHLLLQRRSQARLLAHSRGATVEHINLQDIRAFPIGGVPSLEIQAEVVERLEAIDERIARATSRVQARLQALDDLKNSLLEQAFTGELTARSADQRLALAA